ncbi:hypothetical protein EJ02DRAFT_437485 [Clathrospora elynae]|uniref:BZIP domain-containing protein n=1 Tax=Clathrospora elynae TaxID=706981 RepID=A0A6A5SKR3_9PLEO|nr:hypothetical protein EJ02DRAFT_437485 [Clathrospora elynae]
MASNDASYAGMSDNEVVRPGRNFGYGNWLQSIIKANDQSGSSTAIENQSVNVHASTRRGRGRPRLTKPGDKSAIEKRRAQVREAQRTYQKRKDTCTATEKRRVNELLQVLADLSSDVEALLQTASKAGTMQRDDDVSKAIQQLWSTYDGAINNPSVKPELQLQQLKNDLRLADHPSNERFRIPDASSSLRDDEATSSADPPARKDPKPLFDPTAMSFELVRFEETTVMQPFQRTSSVNEYMAGRSIFDICKDRQEAMKEADRSSSG